MPDNPFLSIYRVVCYSYLRELNDATKVSRKKKEKKRESRRKNQFFRVRLVLAREKKKRRA
jgi:hypothetical protein